MISKMKDGPKLIGGFLMVAFIAAFIGIFGLLKLSDLSQALSEIAQVRLPSVESLLIISEAQSAVDGSENALLSQDTSDTDRQAAYQRFVDAKKRADDAWKIYEPLPQTTEEAMVWKEFVPAWEKWWKDHEDFVSLAREYDRARSSELYKKMSKQALETNSVSFSAAE